MVGRIKISEDANGIFLESATPYLTTSCLGEADIRHDIESLRRELTALERKMVASAKARAQEPILSA